MENPTEILVVGTHADILQTVLRLLNAQASWHAEGASGCEEAIAQCKSKAYRILLLGAGLTDLEEERLKTEIKKIHPEIHIIPHYGGGSGLLYTEIHLALGT
ncbi:response regulator receiver protein [Pedobacter sp. PAMC26386]|nr:response regulator receiver protein [Pedobacter sp. PAMC26386]